MPFTSGAFVVLCLTTLFLYYLPALRRWQVPVLILASFVFYASSSPWLLLLLLGSILINASTSLLVAIQPAGQQKIWAVAGVLANLVLLGYFKYAGLLGSLFLGWSGVPPAQWLSFLLQIPLPIGISFYTFEGISLLVDVWKKKAAIPLAGAGLSARWRHFERTALFIAFFPHLIAGPILKAAQFFPQIGPKHWRDIPWETAFRCLVTGYFLKMVVADNLQDYTFWLVAPYYQHFDSLTNAAFLFGYSMQIFADFAGYSLIAIGLAALFGYDLPANFNRPYLSRSLAEFWKRWHLSLSTWLRDYLYFPLGGNRHGAWRTYRNLLIVMLLGGLWHGAAWNFLLWGGWHGLGLAAEKFVVARSRRFAPVLRSPWLVLLLDVLRMLGVFLFVTVGWLFFKLPNVPQAVDFLSIILRGHFAPDPLQILPILIFSLPVLGYHWMAFPVPENLSHPPIRPPIRLPGWLPVTARALAFGLMLALLILNSGSPHAFIYFQF